VGLTSLFGLPWILKFFWAPFVDEFLNKRTWLLVTEAFLAVIFLLIAFLLPFNFLLLTIAALFFFAAFIAATHDTAIDGFYLEALDKKGQAKFVGYRVMAYRLAMMTGSGIIITIGAVVNWTLAFVTGGLILALLFFFHFFHLPRCETIRKKINFISYRVVIWSFAALVFLVLLVLLFRLKLFTALTSSFADIVGIVLLIILFTAIAARDKIKKILYRHQDNFYGQAFFSFIDQEKIKTIILFIVWVRSGEFMLSAMLAPFIIDLGMKIHYGWISAGVGLPCSISGALLGGWLISRYSLNKMIWPFLLAQNFTNIVYMGLAFKLDDLLLANASGAVAEVVTWADIIMVAGVNGFDQFAGGLGTAVLMTLLMRLCRQEYKAAHYAIGTGLMSVGSLFAGSFSGFLAAWLGYGWFFGVSFLCSLPGMALIFFLPEFENEV
jgi:PAT family beta-lactamase induction signal transducer AmpG